MIGLLFALFLVAAVVLVARRRRSPKTPVDEPWRESLQEDAEALDIVEIRRAEEEWAAEGGLEWEDDNESWRG
ncbi:MAG: hypothetical protein H0U67_10130 [Gemmatimonadetes bacterium]|nr:hypothetical protein [Gemmatimonadota bacterium]